MQGSHGAARPCSRPLRLATLSAIKRTTEKNVVCIKMLKIRAGSEKAVLRLCHEVTAFSKAQQKTGSSGILAFECSEVCRGADGSRMALHAAFMGWAGELISSHGPPRPGPL